MVFDGIDQRAVLIPSAFDMDHFSWLTLSTMTPILALLFAGMLKVRT